MKSELSKLVSTSHFPSVIRTFNISLHLTDIVVVKDKATLIEDVGQMILDEKTAALMQLVKDGKVSFDPSTVNTFGHVQTLQVGEYLLIKSINNAN